MPNSAAARSAAPVVVGADDLGQRAQLLERVALGDPLRAERDVDVAARARPGAGRRSRSCPGRPCSAGRRARRRAGAGAIWSTAFSKIVIDGPEELVDRRADDDDELVRPARSSTPSAPNVEPAGRQDLAQELVGAGLHERHLAARRSGRGWPGWCRRCRRAARPRRRRGSAAGRRGRRRRARRHRGRGSVRSCPDSTSPVRSHRPESPVRCDVLTGRPARERHLRSGWLAPISCMPCRDRTARNRSDHS